MKFLFTAAFQALRYTSTEPSFAPVSLPAPVFPQPVDATVNLACSDWQAQMPLFPEPVAELPCVTTLPIQVSPESSWVVKAEAPPPLPVAVPSPSREVPPEDPEFTHRFSERGPEEGIPAKIAQFARGLFDIYSEVQRVAGLSATVAICGGVVGAGLLLKKRPRLLMAVAVLVGLAYLSNDRRRFA